MLLIIQHSQAQITTPSAGAFNIAINRDVWISSVEGEELGNNGGAKQLKLKGQQEFFLFDADLSALKGKIISKALLHVRSASPEKAPLLRVGVSTVASPWVEGTSSRYRAQEGSSCFKQAQHLRLDWAYPGSTVLDVIFGRGNTKWGFADSTPPDQKGWQTVEINPEVIAAKIAGISYGFSAWDEVGNEWSIDNGKFNYRYFPNRFVFSRESGGNGPWLEVWADATDTTPPAPVNQIIMVDKELPPGEALIRWQTPEDVGGSRAMSFLVAYDTGKDTKSFPRYLVPMAGEQGQDVFMHIQDMPFAPGQKIRLSISAVDGAGNISAPSWHTLQLPAAQEKTRPGTVLSPERFQPSEPLVINDVKVAALDLLDKVDPQTGEMIPEHDKDYKTGNHIFSAAKRLVRLRAARNETVSFQLNLEGKTEKIAVSFDFEGMNIPTRLYRYAYVKLEDREKYLPDPLLPWEGNNSIPPKPGFDLRVPEQKNYSLLAEFHVPHAIKPGKYKGTLRIASGGEELTLAIDLEVSDFTLPDKLSFVPEMNAYGTVYPFDGYKYYRLAHEHRTCLNWLPYGWDGKPALAPKWDGENFDWQEWDKQVTPLLTGEAFRDLPRSGQPVDVFYLPFNENWPVALAGNYQKSYWAEEALSKKYAEELKEAFRQFAEHVKSKNWSQTAFQFYLNNKIIYRKQYPQASVPWIFDEPVNTQDFWALRWYGKLWRSAVAPYEGNLKLWFRADVSQRQFARNLFAEVTDIEYLGANNLQKTRMIKEDQLLFGRPRMAEYGNVNSIAEPNTRIVQWCLSAWKKGAIGVLPWQTIGKKNSWETASKTALIYPHPTRPMPSLRLKAFTRGQQDIEYQSYLSVSKNELRTNFRQQTSRRQ